MAGPDDPTMRHRGPKAPSAGTPVGWGKGTGDAPIHKSVAWLKAVEADAPVQWPNDGVAGHHDGHNGGVVGR
jgi:hypothetical protein